MYLFGRNKFFLYGFYLTVIVGFISICYITINQFSQVPIVIQSSITYSRSNVSLSDETEDKCMDKMSPSGRRLRNLIDHDDILNYVGFVLRSHSLFYCSVPKVATRTLLLFLTYLHIRDDLIPLLTNNSRSDILNNHYFNQINLSSIKDNSRLTTSNSLSFLQLFLSQLLFINSSKIDLWSIYQKKSFPLIRLRTLSDPSILFSSKYVRVIFVRHPFERLASAYIDKITSTHNQPFSLYDNIRRAICRKYSIFYLTKNQRAYYRTRKRLIKKLNEPCQKVIPTFEHFIEYLIGDSVKDDVHWRPYSSLCHVCLFKYNFIGKFETIEDDIRKFLIYLQLNSNDWIKDNYFQNGKTKKNYQFMFSNLTQKSICFLKKFYQKDLKLFHYQIEDYFTDNKTIQCPKIHSTKMLITK